ncbi:MAG: hypothetical protein LJE83_03545 [Gammaproteobacteria bacterium]|nr:hypothetical protein [Gammaproteobacteria bacterium]
MLYAKSGLLFVIALFILTRHVFAETSAELNLNFLNFNYEEFDTTDESLDKEAGIIPGFTFTVSKYLNNFNNTISFEAYDGEVDYNGQLQSGIPHSTRTNETLYRAFYKLNWSPTENNISIYGKTTWQQWNRDVLPENNISGLFEQYQWWSFEIGVFTTLFENSRDKWLLEFGTSKINHGTIKIDLSSQNFGQPVLQLGNGSGISVALIYQHKLSDRNELGLSLHYQRWTFGRSNTKTISNGFITIDITEPRSVSNQTALSFSYKYYF